jgi:hemerythrin-like domain-containing protein
MDAVKLLKDDHKRVKALFRDFEGAGERAHKTKQKIAEQVFLELEVHTKLEEEIFYPAAKARGSEDVTDVVDEGLEEHHVVELLIAELKQLDPSDGTFDPKFKVLTENVEHHIEEEEGELLPEAAKDLGSETEQLGNQMEQRKRQLLRELTDARP